MDKFIAATLSALFMSSAAAIAQDSNRKVRRRVPPLEQAVTTENHADRQIGGFTGQRRCSEGWRARRR